jgi:hypothetical protein
MQVHNLWTFSAFERSLSLTICSIDLKSKAQRQDHKKMTEMDDLLFQRGANGSKNMPLAVPWQPWQQC